MTCCTCASRFILILFNIIFFIVGLALSIAGGLLAWNYQLIAKLVDEAILPAIQNESGSEQTSDAIKQLIKTLTPFGLGIFITGIIIMLLCILGMFGAICYNRCILTVYLVLHGVLVIGEIVVIIIYAAKPELITDKVKLRLLESVNNYVSVEATDTDSVLMNALMFSLRCCGVDNGKDFNNSTKFKREYVKDGVTYQIQYPVTCCKFDDDQTPQTGCPQTFTPVNSNVDNGCWDVLKKDIDRYGHLVIYASIGVIALQVILLIACLVLLCLKKD